MPATFTVVNNLEGPVTKAGDLPGSLRQALFDANALAGADSIVFDAGVFSSPQLIALTAELVVTDSVDITGTSAVNVAVDGGGTSRVFQVNQTSGQITVNFKNLTIQNGKALTAVNGEKDGGGIYNADEIVGIDGCVFTGNFADEGGAVTLDANGGSLSITNSQFNNNNASVTDGGAVNVEANGTLSISGCTITGNIALDDGAGVYVTGAVAATITDSTISNNQANGGAGDGAGIYFFGTGGPASLTISRTTLDGNSALRNGGGFALTGFVTTTITDSTFSNNVAKGGAAGGGGGGGLNISGTAVGAGFTMRNCTVSGNNAIPDILTNLTYGGGIRMAVAFGNVTIQNTTISGNNANTRGGGLLSFAGRNNLKLESTVLSGNNAPLSPDLSSSLVVSAANSAIGTFGGYSLVDLGGNLPVGAALNLGTLAANGGPTQTMLPGAGSPLRNTGSNPSATANDQRGAGFPRVVGSAADVGSVESVDATGTPVAVANLPAQAKSGVATYVVTVVYTDDVGVDVSSIGVADITLSGTGVSVPSPIGFSTSGAGTKVTATYTFAAPDNSVLGSWDPSDNGVFTVTLNPGEVSDLAANAVPGGNLGLFRSQITQTFKVTNDFDFGAGSLRDAVQNANLSPDTNDTVTFDPSMAGKTVTLGGEIQVSDAVTIVGLGAKSVTVNGGGVGRIFNISGAGPVAFSLSGVTLTGGKRTGTSNATDRGGAIFSEDDPVTLNDVIITGNTSENDGAAVAMNGGNTLTITNSVISNNTATGTFGDAGGVFGTNGPTVLIQNSTISGNRAFFSGGGLYFVNAKVTLDSSTVSGNVAQGTSLTYSGGGGLYLTGGLVDVLITNSTLSNNVAGFNGGGVLFRSSFAGYNVFSVRNSTITSNRSLVNSASPGTSSGGGITITGTPTNLDVESSVVSGNVGNLPDFSTLGAVNSKNSAIGSKTGITTLNDLGGNLPLGASLVLGTLAANGGPTQTHLPGAGSPLIGAGTNPGLLANDQRGVGFPRNVGGTPDIGAVESTGALPVSVAGPFADVTVIGGTFYDFSVTYVDDLAIKMATVDGNDITVTGPGGFSTKATVKTAPLPGDGTPRTIVYSFSPAGGTFDGTNNGFYTFSLNAGEVSDTTGNFVAGGTLGLLRVNTPQVLKVNATNDETTDTDTKLSLREAILAANASIGLDQITFDPAVFGGSATIGLTLGAIQISDDVNITGLGATKVVIDGAGNGAKRHLRITNVITGSHLSVSISGVTFQNAANTETLDGTTRGGSILIADEFVTLTDVVFNNNSTIAGGGAVAVNGSAGRLTVVRGTFTGNKTTGADTFSGGAIRTTTTVTTNISDTTFTNNESNVSSGGALAVVGADLTLTGSTFSGNLAGNVAGTTSSFGGAIVFGGTPAAAGWTIRNSTFTGNQSAGRGGAVFFNGAPIAGGQAGGELLIQNSTLTGNTSNAFGKGGGPGGGISSQYGGVVIRLDSSIVSGNLVAATPSDLGTNANALLSARFSAIGTLANVAAGTFFDLGNNLIGANLDLQTLASNGGPTQTIGLGPASAAIDAGANTASLANDQRGAGFARAVGVRPDIGAFEVQTPVGDLPRAVVSLPAEVTTGGATTFNVVVDYVDTTGVDGSTIDVNDVTVKGGVFGAPVLPTGVVTSGTGSKITATYTFAAPAGAFSNATNGTYTVTLMANQVSDTSANPVFAADTDFGSFRSAVGKSFVVNSGGDAGAGTLRQAVLDANASLGVDTITFDPTVFPSVTNTVTLTSGEIAISEGLVIQGLATADTKVAQTKAASRVFRVQGQGQFSVTFDKLTISGGNFTTGTNPGAGILVMDESITVSNSVVTGNSGVTGGGGIALWEGGNLTLINSTVSNNTNTAFGGGIAVNRNGSSVVIQSSTVSGNTSTTNGGGAYFNYGGSVHVLDSTFSGNTSNTTTSNGGGGLGFGNRIAGAGFLVRNSTFSGNTAAVHGGGISFTSSLQGTALIQNSTFTKNTANSTSPAQGNSGGGIAWRLSVVGAVSNFAQLNVESSIVAGNTANSPDVSTQNLVVGTNSLFGVGDTGFVLTGSGNLSGTKATPLDAKLDVLANNGGPTFTHALLAGSPAIDAGSNLAGLAFDQRGAGFNRTAGGKTDIGAFEVQAAAAPPTVTSLKVNGGGAQRSMVTSIVVTFSEAVTFPSGINGAFQLARIGQPSGGPSQAAPLGLVNTNAVQAGNQVTITFAGGGAVPIDPAGSLIDGLYQLTIVASKVSGVGGNLDGDGNGTGGDNFQTPAAGAGRITRLFGDGDGDGDNDAVDYGAFRGAFGGANPTFDYDGDADVDSIDFGQFRQRFGVSV